MPSIPSRPTRRDALLGLALGGGALLMPGLACVPEPSLVAEPKTTRWFVFYYLMGGWDLSLLTEPAVAAPNYQLQYRPDEIWETGGHRFGPAMRPLAPYLDRAAIIRGIKCEALNHPQARFQMVTGHFRAPHADVSASVQSHIAKAYGQGYPLPNISSDSMRPAVYLGDLEAHVKPVRVSSVAQLQALTSMTGKPAGYADRIMQTLTERDEAFARTHAAPLAREFTDYAALARRITRSDFGRRVGAAGPPAFDETPRVRHGNTFGKIAHLAAEVVRRDLAPVVTVGSGEFDAHNENIYAGHRTAVTRAMETVAAICESLDDTAAPQGGTLLDHTTVVVTSEFSREPWVNELGGKHHWPANSVLMIGRGVRHASGGGPRVFGECDDMQFPQPIDPATGRRDGRGADELLVPHALATIMAVAGLDPRKHFDVDPIADVIG